MTGKFTPHPPFNWVFILGAGASMESGCPSMASFFGACETAAQAGTLGDFTEDFYQVELVRDYLRDRQVKMRFEVDHMERLFSALELGSAIGGIGDLSKEQVEKARRSFGRLTAKVLASSQWFPLGHFPPTTTKPEYHFGQSTNRIRAAAGYERLCAFLTSAHKQLPEHRCSVITFNYDIGLELSMLHSEILPFLSTSVSLNDHIDDFGFSFGVPVYKLHGSIDLVKGAVPTPRDRLRRLAVLSRDLAPDKGEATTIDVADALFAGDPAAEPDLVPPGTEKGRARGLTADLWSAAANAISMANVICVIGYSMPDTDLFFETLLKVGLASRTRVRRIVVIDPSAKVGDRLRSMVGESYRSSPQFKQYESGFDYGMEDIITKLEQSSWRII